MALVGIELETLVAESDALTTRPPPCAFHSNTLRLCLNSFSFRLFRIPVSKFLVD